MRAAADTMEPFDDAMASLYADRAGVKKTKATEWMDNEWSESKRKSLPHATYLPVSRKRWGLSGRGDNVQ